MKSRAWILVVAPVVCACLLGPGGTTLQAQNYFRAVQQARRDSAQNDAEQQRISNAANGNVTAPAPAPATPAPADPVLQATLKNVAGLQTDFAGLIKAADKADPAQKTSLLNDLTQAAQGTKADADTVKKLAEHLAAALAGQKKLVAAQQTKLAREVHALFNSAHLSPAQQQTLLTDIQKTLTDAGASADAVVDVVTDLKTVVTQTAK